MKKAVGLSKLARTTEKTERLHIITKLITIFESFDSVDEAVKSFS